jgi:hypothetical protein
MSRRKRVRSGGGQTETRNPVPGHPSSEERTPDTRLRKRATNETTTNERRRTKRRRTNDERAKDERLRSRSNASAKTKPGAAGFVENAPVVLDLPAALSSDVDRPTGPGGGLLQKQYAMVARAFHCLFSG